MHLLQRNNCLLLGKEGDKYFTVSRVRADTKAPGGKKAMTARISHPITALINSALYERQKVEDREEKSAPERGASRKSTRPGKRSIFLS